MARHVRCQAKKHMNYIKKYLESIRRYSSPKTRALEQELYAVREVHAAVSADLANVRENLRHTHEADAQRLADLQQQVRQIEDERSNTHDQVKYLERSLAAADQRQKSTEMHVGTLEAKLEEERSNAREQVVYLDRSLAAADQRQKSIETHVGTLEAKLEEERGWHESRIHATEAFLTHLQDEQKSQLKLQSELANTLHGVATRLQDSLQSESKKPQHSLLNLMVVAVVLFVTGTLAGVFTMQTRQDRSQGLAAVERDIREMRAFMKQHIDNQDAVLNELTQALKGQIINEQALVEKKPLVQEAGVQGADIQQQKTVLFKPHIRELQADLIALGFDLGIAKPNGELGIRTKQALQEFKQFYLPPSDAQDDVVSEPLAALILKSADLARVDAARFTIGSDVLAAIRLGSIRTGVDFSFLMELARVESNFNPTARAPGSSATGLFQFKDYPWLEAIRAFGADYGLKDYATRVQPINDEEHEEKPIVRDPLQLEVLALRLNPRLSTLMAAENIKRNLQILSGKTRHEPGRTELYLAHYFGPDGAVMFLKTLDEKPATIAGDIFPKEAASNPEVFESQRHQPRTVAEVYRLFDSKFNTARYDERNPG
jgi:peptidoglycan hydrolase-like protein with peptidoglycan-binding domain